MKMFVLVTENTLYLILKTDHFNPAKNPTETIIRRSMPTSMAFHGIGKNKFSGSLTSPFFG